MLLEAVNVDRFFQDVCALAPVSVSVTSGEFLVITGASGSGKSTLLNLLSGLDRPSHGDIRFRGESLAEMNEKQCSLLRNASFGYIFQIPHLLQDKTVFENTMLPFHYGQPSETVKAHAKCSDLLDYLGLTHLARRYPRTLSGGEMQRVVFARALCRDPDVIFADEPTGSLDQQNSGLILELLQEQQRKGRTVIMVTHDADAVKYGSVNLHLRKF